MARITKDKTAVAAIDPLNHLDLAFIVDTTGSMGPFIDAARQHTVATLRRLTSDSARPVDLRTAVVEYRDHPPQDMSFVTREYGFTNELPEVQKVIAKLKPDGGGDMPEAVLDGIHSSCRSLEWRPYSRRTAILIGDAPPHGWRGQTPHGACACGETVDSATAVLEQQRIVLYAVGLTSAADASFMWLARATGGSYVAAHRGHDAIDALEALLAREFAELDFDSRVRDGHRKYPEATVDELAAVLDSLPGRVAVSLSRLGRRGLLAMEPAASAVH
ncbi:MAG TPA: vWA domain-containing protein [Gemmataceae bacterium]|nr:vWA domain-containing protein [Gemmataceae bacterium]